MDHRLPRIVVFYALMIAVGLLGAISDAILNKWATVGGFRWLVGSYVSWCAVATVLGLMFRTRHFSFGSAIVVFLLANCAFAIAIDHRVFGGKVSGWQWAGIGLALISLVLLELGKESPEPPQHDRAAGVRRSL